MDKFIHFSDWDDIKKHYASARQDRFYDREYDAFYRGNEPKHFLPVWLDPVVAAWAVFQMRWLATVCEFRGHDITADNCNPESGGEDLTCERCGWSQRVYHR